MLEWTCHIIAFSHIVISNMPLWHYANFSHLTFVHFTSTCSKWFIFFNLSQNCPRFVLIENPMQKDYKTNKLCSNDIMQHVECDWILYCWPKIECVQHSLHFSPIEEHKFGQLKISCEKSNCCNNQYPSNVCKVLLFCHQCIVLLMFHQLQVLKIDEFFFPLVVDNKLCKKKTIFWIFNMFNWSFQSMVHYKIPINRIINIMFVTLFFCV